MAELEIRGLIAPDVNRVIANLQQQIDQLRFDLTQLELRVDQNEIDIADLQNRVTILEGQVAQLIIDVDQLQLDVVDLQTRVQQLEGDVAQLQLDVVDLQNRVAILEQYFDTKEDGSLIVDVTKSLNFTGRVTVTQDGLNLNQANINIDDQAVDIYRNGVLFQADIPQIDFSNELDLISVNPNRVAVSYTRPRITSKDSGVQVVADTLSIDVTGDLTATGNSNEVTINYDRPEIISKDSNVTVVSDTLSFNFIGDIIATGLGSEVSVNYVRPPVVGKNAGTTVVSDVLSINTTGELTASNVAGEYTIAYTRPKLITQEDTVTRTADTLTLNFTGDVTVTNSGTTSNINIDNTPNLTVQKNGSNVQANVNVINFNSNDYNVTSPSSGSIAIEPRARSFSNSSRSLNSNFIISNDRDAICTYTFSFTNSTTLGGGTSGRVDAQTSSNGTTFTTQASAGNGLGGGIIIGIAVTATNIIPVTIYVPAGFTVRLASSGSGASFVSAMEVLL